MGKALGLRRSDARVVRGMKGREKVVEVTGAEGVDVAGVEERLRGMVE